MRINSRPSVRAALSLSLLLAAGLAAQVRGQGLPALFDSPWRGFDAGTFATGFDPGGFAPVAVAVGDLDGDGDADVLTGNANVRPGLSVLLNAGDGTYLWPAFYTLPQQKDVGDVALADVDGDGDLDALATIPDTYGLTNILALWRNDGTGVFGPRAEFTTGPGPLGMALADFNGDGFTDVATADHGYVANANNTVSVLLHNGLRGAAAGFLAPASFGLEGMDARRVAAADVNGDGRPDLAVGGRNLTGDWSAGAGRTAVLINDGAGRFAPAGSYGNYPEARAFSGHVALADLDKDGDADLVSDGVVTSGSSDRGVISVRRNAGDGTFGPAEGHLLDLSVWVPGGFTVGDLNRDTYPDVAAATPSGRTMDGWVALLSDGRGGFRTAARYEASQQTADTAFADADRDGDLDVLTVAQSSAALTVHRNNGDGSFPVLPRLRLAEHAGLVGSDLRSLETADLDGDGDQDIVTNGGKTYVLKNNGNGTFAAAQPYTPPHGYADAKPRDLNGDGRPDLLFGPDANFPPYNFATALNNGDGTFAPGVITPVNACQAGMIDAADFDADGDLDVVLTEEGSCMNGPGKRIFIYRNDGRANFTSAYTFSPDCFPSGVSIGDVNHDGRLDLVVSHCTGVAAFHGNGDLTFGPLVPSADTARPFKHRLADMTGDGRLDVAMIAFEPAWGTATIAVAPGRGDGTFGPAFTQSGSSVLENLRISNDIDVADADGDGDADIVTTNSASNDVSFFPNNGDGSLARQQRYGVGYGPLFSALADFDGDGALDLASHVGLPQAGILSAAVILRNTLRNPRGQFTISGRVTDAGGAPVTGAQVSLTGQSAATATTGADGAYSFGGLAEGGYTVRASKEQHDFTPASHTFDRLAANQTLNFTGRLRSYAVGGRLTLEGQPLPGATVSLSGARTETATTDAQGRYTFSAIPAGSSVTVTPSMSGRSFTPSSATFNSLEADAAADFSASGAITPRVNHAAARRGGTATASSTLDSGRLPLAAINGDRKGQNWGSSPSTGSGWHDATGNAYPDWLEVNFGGTRSVDEVNVFSLQDNFTAPAEPTEAMTFTKYGVTDFTVEFWNEATAAWVPVPGGVVTGNNRVWRRVSFAAVSTPRVRVLIAGAQAGYSRLAELEAWGSGTAQAFINHAHTSEGATASASSTLDANRAPLAAINGDRRGQNWGSNPSTGSGWHDATQNAHPDWLEVTFNGARTVNELHLFSLQDNFTAPSTPTEAMTFTKYGVTGFTLEYWTGSAWAAVPGGSVTGNNKVWVRLAFSPVTTTKLRVVVTGALAGYSRIVELEAWGPPDASARPNVAAAANGATATASSTLDSNRAPLAAINGDRRAQNWGSNPSTGSGWHCATNDAFPDWLEVTFDGEKTISEVSVFSVQDNVWSPSEPTEAMTFSQYGLTDFDVEYWNGSAWQVVPGGTVVGNNKVWAKVSFAPLSTAGIRIVSKGALAGYSRIAEVEAY